MKKMLNYAAKNKDVMTKNIGEKVYIINNIVLEFSHQFIALPVGLFETFVDISFVMLNLYFLVNHQRFLQMTPPDCNFCPI